MSNEQRFQIIRNYSERDYQHALAEVSAGNITIAEYYRQWRQDMIDHHGRNWRNAREDNRI